MNKFCENSLFFIDGVVSASHIDLKEEKKQRRFEMFAMLGE